MDTNPEIAPVSKAKPAKTKKLILIGGSLVLIIAAVVSAVLLINLNKDDSEENEKEDTVEKEDEDVIDVVPSYSVIDEEDKGDDVDIELAKVDIAFQTAELVGTRSFFKANTGGDYPSDVDPDGTDGYKVYKCGDVESGKSGTVNLAGLEYYIAIINSEAGYFSGMGGLPDYIKYLQDPEDNQKIYLIEGQYGSLSYDPQYDSMLPEVEVVDLSEQFDLVVFNPYAYEIYPQSFKSDNGLTYSRPYFISQLAQEFAGTKVDSLDNNDIYLSSDKKTTYFISPEGFIFFVQYKPTIISEESYDDATSIPTIVWNDGTKNESGYDYISIGGCGGGINGLEVADIDSSLLAVAGVDDKGNSVYEYVNGEDPFARKFYDEDYIQYEFNKHNATSEDDLTPFTYEQFYSYHPVFYWQDEFGRLIRFASRNFIMTGGCAKPIIYLYPTESKEVSVKVVPNGTLTFTYPEYNNVWKVLANPNGELQIGSTVYQYLWWESRMDTELSTPQAGFVVANNDLENFFKTKLSLFGLTSEETNAFTDFWTEKMRSEDKPYYFVTFLFNDEVNQIAELEFDKKVDTLMRVFMVYEPLDSAKEVTPLQIPEMEREGFTVVEWGGAKK